MDKTKELQTIEPDDLFRLKFLQEGKLSPDGKSVAYVVSHVDPDKEEEYLTLWLLSLDTGSSRQLTAGLARDWNPQWSPDGKQIAFLSTRGDKPQIYLISVDGGEARALTAMKQGVGGGRSPDGKYNGPVWSPDGKYIAFTSGPAVEPLDLKKPYRVTRRIYRFDGMGYLDNMVQDIYVIPAQGGEPQQLTSDECQNIAPLWSPDGQEILYTVMMVPDSHQVSLPRLRVVNLEGEVREIVGDWGYANSAAWLPDGERVVFVGRLFGRLASSKDDLWVIDKQGGEPECRTAGLKFGVGSGLQPDMPTFWESLFFAPKILLTRDGKTAYVQVQDGGTIQIYRVTLTGPESWDPVVVGERTCLLLDTDDRHLLFASSTLENPVDLFLAEMDGTNERQLTHLNADLLAERALPTIEHLLFPAPDGVPVEGWILKPCIGEAPYPTILYIHGGPYAGFGHIFSFDFQMLAGAGYAVLFINYRGSSGYGDEFATQINGDLGNLEYKDLIAGVDFAIEKGIADPNRLGCCGLSYGGYMTCWITEQTDRFKAAVPENPVINYVSFYGVSDIGPRYAVEKLGGLPHEIPEVYRRCSPITYAHRCKTPTLLLQGEADYCCPAEQAEQFYAALKASSCPVEMVRFPGSSHSGSITGAPIVRRVQNEVLLDWMNRYVLGIEPVKGTTS